VFAWGGPARKQVVHRGQKPVDLRGRAGERPPKKKKNVDRKMGIDSGKLLRVNEGKS